MKPSREPQLELSLDGERSEEGFNQWREQRRVAMTELARELGLPLNHTVEVWLRGNIRLRGQLRLAEEPLFVEESCSRVKNNLLALMVDGVPFKSSEIESCVRID